MGRVQTQIAPQVPEYGFDWVTLFGTVQAFGSPDVDGHCILVIKEQIKLAGLAADGTLERFEAKIGGVKATFEARLIDPVSYFQGPSKFTASVT